MLIAGTATTQTQANVATKLFKKAKGVRAMANKISQRPRNWDTNPRSGGRHSDGDGPTIFTTLAFQVRQTAVNFGIGTASLITGRKPRAGTEFTLAFHGDRLGLAETKGEVMAQIFSTRRLADQLQRLLDGVRRSYNTVDSKPPDTDAIPWFHFGFNNALAGNSPISGSCCRISASSQ